MFYTVTVVCQWALSDLPQNEILTTYLKFLLIS